MDTAVAAAAAAAAMAANKDNAQKVCMEKWFDIFYLKWFIASISVYLLFSDFLTFYSIHT